MYPATGPKAFCAWVEKAPLVGLAAESSPIIHMISTTSAPATT